MKLRRLSLLAIAVGLFCIPTGAFAASDLAERVSGYILLDVEQDGEAWYVHPDTSSRYYLRRPADAFQIMRQKSLGITNADLARIPTDTDAFEGDMALRERLSGKILLQVEENGEAWYVYPGDLKRYYMGRPWDAFQLMRFLSLGITHANLQEVLPVPPPDFTVAFVGDMEAGANAEAVIDLMQRRSTDLVIHSGDLGYEGKEQKWMDLISSRFGDSFPYLFTAGNHDVAGWDKYAAWLEAQASRVLGLHCEGEMGVNARCFYNGFSILLSGLNVVGSGHEQYLAEHVTDDDVYWRICSWHYNQRLMQVGNKGDEAGWAAYDTCREAGAIIATAHQHQYSRTYLMSNFENQVVANTHSVLELTLGNSFAFVSGLGGRSIRATEDNLDGNNWWASTYTKDDNAKYGALFCRFNYYGGEAGERAADCQFVNTDDEVIDHFKLNSEIR